MDAEGKPQSRDPSRVGPPRASTKLKGSSRGLDRTNFQGPQQPSEDRREALQARLHPAKQKIRI